MRITENGDFSYWIAMLKAPTTNATVLIHAGAGVTVIPTEVQFTSQYWRSYRPITVTAEDDTDAIGGSATITHSWKAGSASEYLSVSLYDVQVVIADDDDAGVSVTLTAGDDIDGANDEITIQVSGTGGTSTLYSGSESDVAITVIDDDTDSSINPTEITVPEVGSNFCQAMIISEPSGTVSITITADQLVTASETSFSFGYGDRSVPRYVILTPKNPVTQDTAVYLSHVFSGASPEYDVLTLPDVMVTIADAGPGPVSLTRADEADGLRISWSAPPVPTTHGLRTEVLQYELERSVDDGAFEFVTGVDADTTTYFDDSIDSHKAYLYRVRAGCYATNCCSSLRDIELGAGTAATAATAETSGVWSDSEIMWVAHDGDSRLYAHDLETGAASADDDITPSRPRPARRPC